MKYGNIVFQPFTPGYFFFVSIIFYVCTPLVILWGTTKVCMNLLKDNIKNEQKYAIYIFWILKVVDVIVNMIDQILIDVSRDETFWCVNTKQVYTFVTFIYNWQILILIFYLAYFR